MTFPLTSSHQSDLQPKTFHPWFYFNPTQEVAHLNTCMNNFELASKVTIATLAVFSFAATILPFFVKTKIFSISIILLSLSSPTFCYLASQLNSHALKARNQILKIEPISVWFEKIQNSTKENQEALLKKFSINKALADQDITPVIARFIARQTEVKEQLSKTENLLKRSPHLDNVQQLWNRNLAWSIRENIVIPYAIEAAFCLNLLEHPNFQGFPNEHFKYYPKNFDERQFDRILDNDDKYLEFLQQNRKALSFKELSQQLEPSQLTQVLFGSDAQTKSIN